jgi:hypothetical protein
MIWIALDEVASVVANLQTHRIEQEGNGLEVECSTQIVISGAADNVLLIEDNARGFLVAWAKFTNDDEAVRLFEDFERVIVGDEAFDQIKVERDQMRARKARAQKLKMNVEECEEVDSTSLAGEVRDPDQRIFYKPDDLDRKLERKNPALRTSYSALRLIDPETVNRESAEVRLNAKRVISMARQGMIS